MTVSANNELVNQALMAYQDSLAAASSSPDKMAIEQHIKGKLRRFTADIPD